MKVPHPTKRQWIIISILFLSFYGVAYFATRQTCLLVHRVGFETRRDGARRSCHWIDTGDFTPGEPYFTRWEVTVTFKEQRVAFWVFTPLRWAETLLWYAIPRTYEHRNGA